MEVFEATDLILAFRAIPIFEPNLILSQLRLPTYGGLELVRRLKEGHATQSIPVLLYAVRHGRGTGPGLSTLEPAISSPSRSWGPSSWRRVPAAREPGTC